MVRTWCVLYIFTSKCASRHNACTFSTSQVPKVVRTPQFLTHVTSKRASRIGVPIMWSCARVLERSNFFAQVSGFKMQKCASRYNGVQLFIAHLPRCLRTRRPSEPTFQPSGATKPRKNTVFRDFPTFSRTCIFFLLIFSLLTLLPADCFFISPYCRKFDFQTSFDDHQSNNPRVLEYSDRGPHKHK